MGKTSKEQQPPGLQAYGGDELRCSEVSRRIVWPISGSCSMVSNPTPGQAPVQEPEAASSSKTSSTSNRYVEVSPSDVVLVGSGVVTAAAVAAAVSTYRSGSKSLIEDGINPSHRMRMIPVAFQTLMLSTLFTGILGAGGFYALRAAGWFSQDKAELPSATEAVKMLRNPRGYIRAEVGAADAGSPPPGAASGPNR